MYGSFLPPTTTNDAAASALSVLAHAIRGENGVPPILHIERINCLVCLSLMPLAPHLGGAAATSGDAASAFFGLVMLAYGLVPPLYAWYYRRKLEVGDGNIYVTDIDAAAIANLPRSEKRPRRDAPILIAHLTRRRGFWSSHNPLSLRKSQMVDDARQAKVTPTTSFFFQ